MRGTEEGYLEEQQHCLPYGHAWNREAGSSLTGLLRGLALGWARLHNRAWNLRAEADPRSTLELLPDWERELGLPDECSTGAETLQERRAEVLAKYLDEGRQDLAFFQELAKSLGYSVSITEFRPFICGRSRCGDRLNGGHDSRFYWKVTVHGPRIVLFRCGASAPPERLGTFRRAEDLECKFNKYKEAHGVVIFAYEASTGLEEQT